MRPIPPLHLRSWPLALGAAVLLTAALLVGGAASAQEAEVFEVVIPLASLEQQPTSDPGVTLGQSYMRITAYANGEQCAFVPTTAPSSDVVLILGEPGQPDECSTEGATVTFVTGACHQLATQFVLTPGTQETLSNMAPVPPGSVPAVPECVPPPAPTVPPESQPNLTPPPGGILPPNTGDAGLASG